jgi:L-ribulose-5-phosphate 4-epimerase
MTAGASPGGTGAASGPAGGAAAAPDGDFIAAVRREVCALHAELVRNNLVAWTSGNVSARVPGAGLMVIKAGGGVL